MPSNTHWRKTVQVVRFFGEKSFLHFPPVTMGRFGLRFLKKNFVSSSGSLSGGPKLTVSGNFFSPLPTGGFCLLWTKDFEFSFPQSSLDRNWWSGPLFRELFSLHYLLEENRLFGQKLLKVFLQYPLDKNHRFGQKNLKIFPFHYPTDMRCRSGPLFRKLFLLPLPNGHMEPFWTKKNEKSLRKLSEGSRFLHIFVIW